MLVRRSIMIPEFVEERREGKGLMMVFLRDLQENH
jgi:hypothetical protein